LRLISISKTLGQLRKTLLSRHASNAIWNVADSAIYPLVMVFTLRIFMARLGEQQFGIWMWVNTLVATLSFVNIGFGDATLKYVAEYRSKGQMKRAALLINGTLTTYAALALGLALFCFGLAELISYYNLHRLFKIEEGNKALSISAFELGALTFSLRLVESIVLSALKGMERYDASARLSILSKTAVLVLNVWMVLHGFSLIQIFINTAAVTAISLLIEVFWLKRLAPALSLIPNFKNPVLRKAQHYGYWAWLTSVISIFSSQLDKYLVSSLAGVSVFGFYQAAATLGERAHGVGASAAGFLFPIVSARVSNNESSLKLYYKAQTIIVGVGTAVAALLIVFQKPLFTFVFREEYARTSPYLRGFLLYVGALCGTIVPHYFVMGSGLLQKATYVRVAIIVLLLLFVPAAYFWQGPALMPVAVTLSHYLGSFLYAYLLAKNVFHTAAWRFSLLQGLLPGLFFVCLGFGWPLVFLLLGPLVWKFVYFDRISYILKK